MKKISNLRGSPRRLAPPRRGRRPREEVRVLRGVSLIEMLIVVFIFSILGVVVTRTLALSLRGTSKSENVTIVKQNVDFALGTIERHLRNAQFLTCSGSGNTLSYEDQWQSSTNVRFRCVSSSPSYIASSSAVAGVPIDVRLTSNDVDIINCTTVFNCNISTNPHSVDITITAKRTGSSGAEGSQVTSSTKILLRNY